MGNISIEINNREFLIACTDGDEDKVMNLALKFASRVKSIKERVGELDQQRLFLLALELFINITFNLFCDSF